HILASINPKHPGYVYFTPIRPGHYRVYSQPGEGFWCCVGTGMENPGRYGQFIYAGAKDALYVNLFIASELTAPKLGLTLRQETRFPDEERTQLNLKLAKPSTFTLHLRVPGWVPPGKYAVTVNGKPVAISALPSSYAAIKREWKDGDRVQIALPMQTTVEALPDDSFWYTILRGPIVLATPTGTENQVGLRAGDGRGDHIAGGPLIPLDTMPALLTTKVDLPRHVVPDPAAGPLRFKLVDVAVPASQNGIPLEPFFRLHDARYQMYWDVTTKEELAARRERVAAEERAKIARDAATLDSVAVGEQQPEVDHAFTGEETETGIFNGRRWRHGRSFEYTLDTRGEKKAVLAVTYNGGDSGRTFDVLVNGTRLATEELKGERPGEFFERLYAIPAEVLAAAPQRKVTVKFAAPRGLAGGVFDVRLLRPEVTK
ncbi:MAG: glycoside hydrolase family 127 protein, partial [Fibrella sp.]|nr:glycoside hydrolase family 127 protein [Armatimonadota bacterium]